MSSTPLKEEAFVPERHIEFEGVMNFRDLGGYRTSQGATVRWGRLFRSGGLHYMTDADVRQARAMGIRSVLDLRRPDEIGYQGTGEHVDASIAYHPLPVVPHKGSNGFAVALSCCKFPINARVELALLHETGGRELTRCKTPWF